MTVLTDLAGFLVDARPPAEIRRRARIHLLDTLGAAVAGADTPEPARALAAARRVLGDGGQPGWSPVWGTAATLPAPDAARVNGIAAHALELDDTRGCDHSGAVVVPAVLAALALRAGPLPPDGLATAVVAGYEVARRAQTALGGYDAVNELGWHSTGICGPLGAAAGAAAVLGLDAARTTHALGLAAGQVSGSWSFLATGAMAKRLNVGRAAELGVHAAVLAEHGFTGATDAVEAGWGGYVDLYGGAGADPGAFTVDLGGTWQIAEAAIKPYATCRSTHAAVDGLLDGMAEHGWAAGDLRRIVVDTSALIADMCGGRDTTTAVAAQLSMPFALATAALRGGVGLADVTAESRADPALGALMDRVELRIDPDRHGGAAAPRLTVETDADTWTTTVRSARGGRERPLTEAEIVDKFLGLATGPLGAAGARSLAGEVLTPEPGLDARSLPGRLGRPDLP